MPHCLLVKGVRLLTVKAVEVPSSTGFAERHHAEMLNIFPDPYPTTNQSYLDVYPRALNPSDIVDLHLPQNTRMAPSGSTSKPVHQKKTPWKPRPDNSPKLSSTGNSLTRTASASKKDIASKDSSLSLAKDLWDLYQMVSLLATKYASCLASIRPLLSESWKE